MSKPHFLQALLKKPPAAILRNVRTGKTVASVLETAFDSASRNKGLLGRSGLPQGHALLIVPGSLIHTFAMQFAIDIVFVARDGRVLKIRPAVPRSRITGAWGSFAVIEMAAGEFTSSATAPGDYLEVVV